MRHKGIIIALTALLFVLLVIKAVMTHKENTTYPLQLEWSVVHNNKNTVTPKINYAVTDRVNNSCENPLFFLASGVNLGMRKADVERITKADNVAYFAGEPIPCGIVLKYSNDDLLEAVYVRISPLVYSNAPEVIMTHFGNKRVDITNEFGVSEHIWYYPEYYVFLDYDSKNTTDMVYVTVSSYDNKNYWDLSKLAVYGGCSNYDFMSESSSSSSSSVKTYKYGDSDTYQGSSKQAEDLAAIDAYFGY